MTSATEKLRRLPDERGTLTAKQVRKAIEANSWAETSMILEFNDSSWQAIADELNATLGRGAERDGRCLGCKHRLDGMCMLPVGDDYRREFVDDDYFCASWEEEA